MKYGTDIKWGTEWKYGEVEESFTQESPTEINFAQESV